VATANRRDLSRDPSSLGMTRRAHDACGMAAQATLGDRVRRQSLAVGVALRLPRQTHWSDGMTGQSGRGVGVGGAAWGIVQTVPISSHGPQITEGSSVDMA
jgi:hypothetical protein